MQKLVHIKVHDRKEYFSRLVNYCTMGIAETYMDGIWEFQDSENDIAESIKRITENGLHKMYHYNPLNKLQSWLEFYAFNLQKRKRAFQVGQEHYDLGNNLFELMLDPWMQYSCGYWANANNLEEAQQHKLELIAKKLDLKPGMKVLDVGCGFGMLAKYLAVRHCVEVVGVTISEQQAKYASEKCKGLKVEIRVQDYREVTGKFDRAVSVGMMEHVGHKNYREYFQVIQRLLKNDGIFVLQTMVIPESEMVRTEHFVHRYIFPNGQLPLPTDLMKFSDGLFILEDWHCFGLDYAKTLHSWRERFNMNWYQINNEYGERFYKMWIYYLSFFEGVFLSKKLVLWQVVLSREEMRQEYRAAR